MEAAVTASRLMLAAVASCAFATTLSADALDDLSRDFWSWRARWQPFSNDDIPRLARPADLTPDWSAASVAAQQKALLAFDQRWRALDPSGWPVPRQVDHRLVGSALARVHWELETTAGWRRNPLFYVHQTLGSVLERLLPPPPFDETRVSEIERRLGAIPRTLEQARANLTDGRAPFARLAIGELGDVRGRLLTVVRELRPHLPPGVADRLVPAAERAAGALDSYRAWLEERAATMRADTAVGREGYVWFLKNVALLPYTPERLVEMGRQEWERAAAFEAYEQNRNRGLPQLPLPRDQSEQAAWMLRDAAAVRRFLEAQGILTVPAWVKSYVLRPQPAYLKPFASLVEQNDLTGPDRLQQDGTSWILEPKPELGYFRKAYAVDPRTQVAHEGNGHYLQLVLSWAHEDEIRRRFYDSGPNEGLAFYNEELMLQAGLFDTSPRTREIIYSFMRLRALRVEVDVKLALGQFTIQQAADYLRTTVPMDATTAAEEAAFFASGPGQAITYQIGKLQILSLLAEARRRQGDAFSVRAFHDFVWKNGNVPLVLQRYEMLGSRDELDALERLK
jgi:hypothetical protein